MTWSCHYATGCFVAFLGDISILKSGWNMKKILCCPALELYHCLPPFFVVYPCGKPWGYMEKKLQNATNLFIWFTSAFSIFFFFFKSLAVKSKIIYYGLKMIMGMTLELLHYPMKVREIQLLLWRVLRMMIGKILLPP